MGGDGRVKQKLRKSYKGRKGASPSWPQLASADWQGNNSSSVRVSMHNTILPCILIAVSRSVLHDDDYKCGRPRR